MVGSVMTGSARAKSIDTSLFATNVKTEKVNDFKDVMFKSMTDNNGVKNDSTAFKNISMKADKVESNPESKKAAIKDNVNKSSDISESKDMENTDKVDEAVKDIAEKIEEELGITEEELTEVLENLGLTMVDLLKPGNVLKLVLEATGTVDVTAAITDADLSQALKSILDYVNVKVEELASLAGVSVEEFNASLADMNYNDTGKDIDAATNSVDENNNLDIVDDINKDVTVENESEKGSESLEDVIAEKITVNNGEKSNTGNDSMNNDNGGFGRELTKGKEAAHTGQNNQSEGLVSQITQSFQSAFEANSMEVNQVDVVRQVVDSIKLNNTQAMQSIEIVLNPENLGKVNVMVSVREGVVTAQIATENEQVKRAIESQISTLKETFENQGIKVEAVEVTVESHKFENEQAFSENREQQETSGKTRRKINLEDLDFSEDEQDMAVQALVSENSSVEYLA